MASVSTFELDPERDIRNVHGAPGWHELSTPDPDTAAEYLSKLFGWETEAMELAGAPYRVIRVAGHEVGGITAPRPGEPAAPQWSTYITVDDVAAVAEQATALGAQVVVPPTELGDAGSLAVFAEPAAGVFRVFQYPRPFS